MVARPLGGFIGGLLCGLLGGLVGGRWLRYGRPRCRRRGMPSCRRCRRRRCSSVAPRDCPPTLGGVVGPVVQSHRTIHSTTPGARAATAELVTARNVPTAARTIG